MAELNPQLEGMAFVKLRILLNPRSLGEING